MPDRTVEPSTGAEHEKAFTNYDIQACLFDTQRVRYLRDAIFATVEPGHVVVDAGSGTGLLGLFAAQAGAARVYCLETNPDFIPVIRENARRNGLDDRIVAVHGDATCHPLPEPVDVVISEVISAGFFYEPQLQITNHLRTFLKPGGTMIPQAMQNHLQLISAQEDLYGLKLNFDTRFTELEGDRPLTDSVPYLGARFAERTEPVVSVNVRLTAEETGSANAVKIAYRIDFADGISGEKPTDFLLNPQIIFLGEPVDVVRGDEFEVSLDYLAGSNPIEAKIAINRVLG